MAKNKQRYHRQGVSDGIALGRLLPGRILPRRLLCSQTAPRGGIQQQQQSYIAAVCSKFQAQDRLQGNLWRGLDLQKISYIEDESHLRVYCQSRPRPCSSRAIRTGPRC
jgi:hypothetical protein